MEHLYKQHEKLIQKMVYKNAHKFFMQHEEMLSEMNLVFCESVKTYDQEKGKFSTFFMINAKHHIANMYQANEAKKRKMEVLVDFQEMPVAGENDTEKRISVVDLLLKNRVTKAMIDILQIYGAGAKVKETLTKNLRQQGFKWDDIWEGLNLISSL